MLHRDSPLLISPLLGPSFLRWSWGFWRASSAERYRAGLEATVALTKSAFADYDELRAAGVEFEMHSPGMLVAALTEPGLDEYAAMLTEAEEAGYEGPVRVISGEEARELDPALSGGGDRRRARAERALRAPGERLPRASPAWLRANGATVEENTAVDDLEDLTPTPTPSSWRRAPGRASSSARAASRWRRRRATASRRSRAARCRATRSISPRARSGRARSTEGFCRIAGIFDLTGIDEKLKRERIDAICAPQPPS